MSTNKQMVLPEIHLTETLQTKNLDPRFKFGVEVEYVNFYNNTPVKCFMTGQILHIPTNIIRHAAFEVERDKDPETGNWRDRAIYIKPRDVCHALTKLMHGCKFNSPKFFKLPQIVQEAWRLPPPAEIEIDSDGEPIYPWKNQTHKQFWIPEDKPGTAIDQAKILLSQNGLDEWNIDYEDTLTDAEISGIEVISPILTSKDFSQVRSMCEVFRNIVQVDNTCGLHVHVSMDQPFTVAQIKRFISYWLRIESQVISLPFYQKMGEQNCPLSPRVCPNKLDNTTTFEEIIKAMNMVRRQVINLRSLRKYGTIEFRGFQSTLDPKQIECVLQFCLATISNAIL